MADREEIQKFLNETYLFSGLDDATLARIADCGTIRKFAKDAVLYEEGDDALDAYLLLSGMVRFTIKSGSRSILANSVMRSRTVFGWATLIPDQTKRIGSAVALEPSEILLLHGDKLLEVLRDDPKAGFTVMQRLAGMIARGFMETRP